MPFLYRSHGKHCHLRSFQSSCPRCGEDVLYWECTHGSKVFFQYPPYGKLIRHICKKNYGKSKHPSKYQIIVKRPNSLLEKASPSCPTCGKLFKSEKNIELHLKQLSKSDPLHKQYFKNNILIEEKKVSKNDESKKSYKPMFGEINIKNRNK